MTIREKRAKQLMKRDWATTTHCKKYLCYKWRLNKSVNNEEGA
jgi:hypothetical protein